MTFRIALSGLNAASAELAVTANNIANANTTGFKASRAQFADFFPVTGATLVDNAIGAGVRVDKVAQQFTQGSMNFTNNALDLAISGEGFFTLSQGGSTVYSRAGAFGTDRDGYVVNASGARLQVYPPVAGGTAFDTAQLADLQLPTGDNPPAASSAIGATYNLPADAAVPATAVFSSADPTSYNHTTSVTVYDSLGTAHSANLYFIKGATAGDWTVQCEIDGTAAGASALHYDSAGALTTPAGGSITLSTFTPANGAAAMDLDVDLSKSTQFGSSFAVTALSQDGFTTGRLAGVEVTDDGVIQARYTNGQAAALGQVALSTFANAQGLAQKGDTSWAESFASGAALRGHAGSGNFGSVQSGALEGSNVDLTEQLVSMITAQRNFQANAQMITTADQITQTIINIR